MTLKKMIILFIIRVIVPETFILGGLNLGEYIPWGIDPRVLIPRGIDL